MVLPSFASELFTEVKEFRYHRVLCTSMGKIKQDNTDKQIGASPTVVDCCGKEQAEPGG